MTKKKPTEQQVAEIAQKIFERDISEILAGMITPASTAVQSDETPSFSLEDILVISDRIRAMPPVMQTIWVIDYPRFYYEITRFFRQHSNILDSAIGGRRLATLLKIRLLHYTMTDLSDLAKTYLLDALEYGHFSQTIDRLQNRQLIPFRRPGVFIQMNKGPHYEMMISNGKLTRMIVETQS